MLKLAGLRQTKGGLLALLLVLSESLPPALSTGSPRGLAGVIVSEVRRGSAGDKAGLLPGDNVLTWWRQPGATSPAAHGVLLSPFDWNQLVLEEVPRGAVILHGRRGGRARSWTLAGGAPSSLHEVAVLPQLQRDLAALYRRGKECLAAGEVDAGIALFHRAAMRAAARGETGPARWLSLCEARARAQAGQTGLADELYESLAAAFGTAPAGAPSAAQILRERGEELLDRHLWDGAESCFRRALELDGSQSRANLAMAWSLTELGITASRSGGEKDPEPFFRQALALRERLAPGSADVAASWWDRGNDALSNRDFRTARERYARAAFLQERTAPGSIYLAEKLLSLGASELFLGDLDAAERTWERSLALGAQEAPHDPVVAGSLQGLGDVAMLRKDWRGAEQWLTRALRLLVAKETSPQALSYLLHNAGEVERQLGKRAEGTAFFCRAMHLVDGEWQRPEPNQETRLRWGFRFADLYRDCSQSLAELGEARRAFEVLERGRARAFLARLATPPRASGELPPEQESRWRRLGEEYDRTLDALAVAKARPAPDRVQIWNLEGRQRDILRRREQILAGELPVSASRSAEPLALGGLRRALDPGTVLLFFAAGEERTDLFVLTAAASRDGLRLAAFPLAISREALGRRIEIFRSTLIEDRFNAREVRTQGKQLYDLLLRPADSLLARGKRLLIVPDGPLHTLPFAALVRGGRYLAEWKPVHLALSATAYSELRHRRRPVGDPRAMTLVAFGDPRSPGPARSALPEVTDSALRGALRRGLAPLPASRREVEAISRLFPRSEVYLGTDATEERAKRVGSDFDILHFAVHGLLNERTPANSALALSPPRAGEPGNGLLQAWEITEDLHLNADLVTLSACDTALGADMGGEGLLGLTRAFQLAGARSVLATLWGVSDRPSASLIVSFYRALSAGRTKDEALREAQVEQIRLHRGPFYWAAYQLYGDWR